MPAASRGHIIRQKRGWRKEVCWGGQESRHTFCLAPQMLSKSLTRACLRCCSACSRSSKAALIWARASALRSCSCWLMPPTKAMAADSCGSLGKEMSQARGKHPLPLGTLPAALWEIPCLGYLKTSISALPRLLSPLLRPPPSPAKMPAHCLPATHSLQLALQRRLVLFHHVPQQHRAVLPVLPCTALTTHGCLTGLTVKLHRLAIQGLP